MTPAEEQARMIVNRARKTWGEAAWRQFSERERREKAAYEFLTVAMCWTSRDYPEVLREICATARDIAALVEGPA